MIVKKLLVNDGRSEREVLLVGTIVVGRDPSCQLNDLDPLLSRRHAEFVPSGKGVTVRDLRSRNGILVNGDKVPEHVLKPGDVVQLGHLHVRYVEEPVVKSPEDHSRVRAKTETGIEVPTMAPVARPVAPVPMAAAAAPTSMAPIVTSTDDTDLDVTVAPARHAPASSSAAPASPAPLPVVSRPSASHADDDLDATMAPISRSAAPPAADADDGALELPPLPSLEALTPADADDVDMDATVAQIRRPTPHPPAPHQKNDDADATRVPWGKAAAVAEDPDATVASLRRPFDDTHVPTMATSHTPAAPVKTAPTTEARVVANMSLIVTEASPSCQTVIGARPETVVGGGLTELIARTLRFVATGDGPAALSMSVARATSGNTITVTFKTGQATENHS
jgi:FHA domain-containing protein